MLGLQTQGPFTAPAWRLTSRPPFTGAVAARNIKEPLTGVLKALLKKTAAKASQQKKPSRSLFDPTLEATRGSTEPLEGSEAEGIFKEMKRREF